MKKTDLRIPHYEVMKPTLMPLSFKKDWGYEHYRIKQFNDLGYNGEGVRVAVIDTGVEWDHSFLDSYNGKLIVESVVGDEGYDFDSHGSWCCSQFVGKYGWSPNLEALISIKCMKEGQGQLQWFYDAVKLAIEHKADIISASLGWIDDGRVDKRLDEVMYACNERGILFFGAAGNDGSHNDVDRPASHKCAISVGAHDKNLDRFNFSDLGHNLDVYQYGEGIGAISGNRYGVLQGTSMSCPRAAAVAAMFIKHGVSFAREDLHKITECKKI